MKACITSTGTLKAAKAWTETYRRTRHTESAETLVTVMANLRLNGASERTRAMPTACPVPPFAHR